MRGSLFREASTRLRVKICCISSTEEADIAIGAGADALGLVSAMPSGPGPIHEELIAQIIEHAGARADTVLLTSQQTASGILDQATRMRPSVIQLVDELSTAEIRALRGSVQHVTIMPVLHVPAGNALAEALRVAPESDGILLDSGNPLGAVKELGGTGRVHDWSVSRAIVMESGRPVFLAGGLNSQNVADAVRAVRPFGVDVCSGVRTNGALDGEKVRKFMEAAHGA